MDRSASAKVELFSPVHDIQIQPKSYSLVPPRARKMRIFLRSVVLVPLVRALGARVEDRATFVGRSQLLCVVACLGVAAFLACHVDDGVGLDLALVVLLDVGA